MVPATVSVSSAAVSTIVDLAGLDGANRIHVFNSGSLMLSDGGLSQWDPVSVQLWVR